MKLFNLVVRNDLKPFLTKVLVAPFLFDEKKTPVPETALRAAVKAYLASPDSEEAREYAADGFNWGDVMTCMPDEFFVQYGLFPIAVDSVDIEVNHDEALA